MDEYATLKATRNIRTSAGTKLPLPIQVGTRRDTSPVPNHMLRVALDASNIVPSDDEAGGKLTELTDSMKKLQIFYGKSTNVEMVRAAMQQMELPICWGVDICAPQVGLHLNDDHDWTPEFPDPDLLQDLVNLYFSDPINLLLHKPSFQRSISAGLHLRDEGFGGVVLLVCAIASRMSDDKRVLLPGSDQWETAGWRWFRQIRRTHRFLPQVPTLYDLQMYCVCSSAVRRRAPTLNIVTS